MKSEYLNHEEQEEKLPDKEVKGGYEIGDLGEKSFCPISPISHLCEYATCNP